jgi:glycosyltransferase involved in cell wall biosynthesis
MITLCLTTYNRTQLLFDSFVQLINDDRISEIVISDDCSNEDIYQTVAWYCKDIPKVKLYRNTVNLDCYFNKRRSISLATNEWVIIGDSDNIFTKEYVDHLFTHDWLKNEILQPCFARPHFDFTKYGTHGIVKGNVAQYMHDPTFQTMLNAANYFVNRDEYLRVWNESVNPVTSDSIYQAYNWLNAGNSIYVVPGLEYYHRVDNHGKEERSHYATKFRSTPRGFHEDIVNRLKAMR